MGSKIAIGRGRFTLVDAMDHQYLSDYSTWHISKNGYVTGHIPKSGKTGKNIYMHRLIAQRMNLDLKYDVDHKNRNKLDNRRDNIRIATRSQQTANRIYHNKYGFRGVSKTFNTWWAKIKVGDRILYLGSHKTAADAARAYDVAAIQYYGDFAIINFPEARHETT